MTKIVFGTLIFLSAFAFSAGAGVKMPMKLSAPANIRQNYLPILNQWAGDYPITQLARLKTWHAEAPGGYIGDNATFASFWEVFKKGTVVPRIDFNKNLVVFVWCEGADQRRLIAKVTLQDAIAEVVADGTVSRALHPESVAMALAVVPRTGIKFLRFGNARLEVE